MRKQQARRTRGVARLHGQVRTIIDSREFGPAGRYRWYGTFHTDEYGLPTPVSSTRPRAAVVDYKVGHNGYHTVMDSSPKPERTRLTAEDWEVAALQMIADQGVGALAVEALARQLGVTKGSFYWHFRTREALLQAALERWEQYGEREVLGQIEQIADPRQRLPELFRRVAHELQPHRVYAALLKALDHPLVVPVMARVSQRRTEFLHTAYREAGLPPREALNRARLTYAAYVGFLQLNFTLGLPRINHEEFDAYVEHMIATLIPA
jgi:AcrR family transcriptional regulator